jgi:hypothetical protein
MIEGLATFKSAKIGNPPECMSNGPSYGRDGHDGRAAAPPITELVG